MGSEVSVEEMTVDPCMEDRSQVNVMISPNFQFRSRIYKHKGSDIYVKHYFTKYITSVTNLHMKTNEKGLKVVLTKFEADDPEDSIVHHYVTKCDLCNCVYDYHIVENGIQGVYVFVKKINDTTLLFHNVKYNHPDSEGFRNLCLCKSDVDIKFIPRITYLVNHHIHGCKYLVYDEYGKYYLIGLYDYNNLNMKLEIKNIAKDFLELKPIDFSKHEQEPLISLDGKESVGRCKYSFDRA